MTKRDESDNWCNDEIVCPWCGCEESDSWDFGEDSGESECCECGKTFSYQREVSYDTFRDCEQNNEEHDFQLACHVEKYGHDKYECTKCDMAHYINHGEEFDVSKSLYG